MCFCTLMWYCCIPNKTIVTADAHRDRTIFQCVWRIPLFVVFGIVYGIFPTVSNRWQRSRSPLQLPVTAAYRFCFQVTIHDAQYRIDNYKLAPTYPPLVNSFFVNDIADPSFRLLEISLTYPWPVNAMNRSFPIGSVANGFTINNQDDTPNLYALRDAPSTSVGRKVFLILFTLAGIFFGLGIADMIYMIMILHPLHLQLQQIVPAPTVPAAQEQKDEDQCSTCKITADLQEVTLAT